MLQNIEISRALLLVGKALLGVLALYVVQQALVYYTWKKRFDALPGSRGRLLFGNLPLQVLCPKGYFPIPPTILLYCFVTGYSMIYRKHNLYVFWIGPKPYVIVNKAETVEALLSSTTELNKTFEYRFLHDWLGTGLLTSTGSKWRSRRKMLTPSFHFRILDHFQEVFSEQSLVFVNKIKEMIKKDPVLSIVPIVSSLTLDMICETAMGTKLGAQENAHSEYVEAVHTAGTLMMERVLRPFMWPTWFFKLTPPGRSFYRSVKTLHQFTDQVIKERRVEDLDVGSIQENGSRRRLVFLDILLREQKDSGLTDSDIREEVDTFMFEGHDTTSAGIYWALFLLGHHPEAQKKIQDELESIFGENLDSPITTENIKDMKYLDCVLKECQRLYPSVPLIGRELVHDLQVGKDVIPGGSTCMVFPPGLHRDPSIFPDPETFDPDRFLPENCSGRHPYAFVPFSAGPRNCIGQRFALNEEKTVVAQCLRHFNLQSQDHPDRIPVSPELISRPAVPLFVKFTPR